jgi:hypothetical protein
MGVFDRQIATALRLIKRNGRRVWIEVRTPNALPDPNQPWKPSPPSRVLHPVDVVFLPNNLETRRTYMALMGDDTLNGRDFGLMGAVDFIVRPQAGVYADAAGTDRLRTVFSLDELAPNGDPILYTLQFRVE